MDGNQLRVHGTDRTPPNSQQVQRKPSSCTTCPQPTYSTGHSFGATLRCGVDTPVKHVSLMGCGDLGGWWTVGQESGKSWLVCLRFFFLFLPIISFYLAFFNSLSRLPCTVLRALSVVDRKGGMAQYMSLRAICRKRRGLTQ